MPRDDPRSPAALPDWPAWKTLASTKTMGLDEDSGWKNRISFPSKEIKDSEDERVMHQRISEVCERIVKVLQKKQKDERRDG